VFRHLDRLDAGGRFFVDWSADELFVVFYGDGDGDGGEGGAAADESVVRQALAFAHELATTIYEETRAACSVPVTYDVGVAAGNGLLGLLGPRRMKKTTAAGFAAGSAKRLEVEAKMHRQRLGANDAPPFVALDESVWAAAAACGLFGSEDCATVTATAKDIAGRPVRVWHPHEREREREQPSSAA
jgi:hypothetical protein